MNHSELSAFLKRTRIANLLLSSSDEKIETVCKNEDTLKIFADYLCRTIAHMCDSFHNVSKSRQTNSTRRVGSSTIPVRLYLSFSLSLSVSSSPSLRVFDLVYIENENNTLSNTGSSKLSFGMLIFVYFSWCLVY